jgi:hypothetical protein
MLHASLKCWWAGVEGPCLYRPENWLVKQLIGEPNPVCKVGFIRKERLQLEHAVEPGNQ